MADKTSIAWCDSTFNPWISCTKVSPGCDNCYAARSTPVRTKGIAWGPGAPRHRTSEANWRQPITWNAQPFVECMACRWRGELRDGIPSAASMGWAEPVPASVRLCPSCREPLLKETRRRVFCASLADVFDNEVDPVWRADLFSLIATTPNLDWLLLTKRIGNAEKMIAEAIITMTRRVAPSASLPTYPWPWPNVWIMATMVNQNEYDRDIGKLLRIPAAVHGVSIEPMLGTMDLRLGGASMPDYADARPHARLDWVIVGGESGPHARPAHPDWFRSLRDQCAAAGVAFNFKQWGEWAPGSNWPDDVAIPSGERCDFGDAALGDAGSVWRVGKKTAGRLLDGIEHNGFPKAPHA